MADAGLRRSTAAIDSELAALVDDGEVGIQVAMVHGDELLIDAWAGHTDLTRTANVSGETMFPIFSVSKAITAAAVHLQAERGHLAYDASLATYWPEYGTRGKEGVTVAHVLCHRAGVPQMPDGVTPERMIDWSWMIGALAEVEPVFEPGTRNTYLSMVFGWLLGEVVQRTDPLQRSFSEFVRDELCAPLAMRSFYFGVPASEASRVATLSVADPLPPPQRELIRRAVPPAVALAPTAFNRRDVQAACIPAVGAVANASSVARFFALLAGRGAVASRRLLSSERVEWCLQRRTDYTADDETYGKTFPMGVGGFWLTAPGAVSDEGAKILAHTGAGGSIGWADLDSGLSFAVCHNAMAGRTPRRGYGRLADGLREYARTQE